MGTLRFMILNYNNDVRKFTVTFVGPAGARFPLRSCRADGDPTTPNRTEANLEAGQQHSFEIPAGMIFGFVADNEVEFSIEEPVDKILVLTAAGKNPWPPPPDAPSRYDAKDFVVRFENFNRGTAGGADPHVIRYRLEAPHTAESSGASGREKSA